MILNLNQQEKQLGNKFIVILKNLNSVRYILQKTSETFYKFTVAQHNTYNAFTFFIQPLLEAREEFVTAFVGFLEYLNTRKKSSKIN